MYLKKSGIILVIFIALALVGTASASGPTIMFPYDGKLVVTYVESDAGYNNEFGVFTPGPLFLGNIHDVTPPQVYTDVGRCENGKAVVLYIKAPDGFTYTSNANGPDGVDHAIVNAESDSFLVGFEDLYGGGDRDYNDVIMSVACTKDTTPPPIPTPEFPTMALPAALIVGMLGAVLFIQRIKEN